ncbi:MAG: hypothetical protein Q8K79_12075 [Solirubrobacteraceae bacterium]|nr:hypothetical protein [Solirubrobacteraceae bacterium]
MTTEQDTWRQALWAWGEKLTQTGLWEHDLASGELIWSDNLFGIFDHDPGAVESSLEHVLLRTYPDDRDRVHQLDVSDKTSVATALRLGIIT